MTRPTSWFEDVRACRPGRSPNSAVEWVKFHIMQGNRDIFKSNVVAVLSTVVFSLYRRRASRTKGSGVFVVDEAEAKW